MKRKPLWRIAVATSLEAEDAVAELLGAVLGETATSYFDVEAGSCLVSVYLKKSVGAEISAQLQAGLADIKFCGLDIGRATVAVEMVRHEDWAESWKRHFKPIDIGTALLIKPSWSKRQPKKQQKVVILDPGLSFGTGQHPTTSFCLSEVARRVKNGTAGSFLDIGTGSGILAIAAAKLMYHPIKAFDFDPEAIRMAKLNAKTNRVEQKILITRGDATRLPLRPRHRYDLVCANLISTLLLAERDRIVAQLKQGGTLVLAGILQTEFHTVQTAFEAAGLRLVNTQILNEWQSGAFTSEKKV